MTSCSQSLAPERLLHRVFPGGSSESLLCFFSLFFIDFIGVTLVNKINRLRVYNSIIHRLYIVLCVHHPRSSSFSSPFIPPVPSPTSPILSPPLPAPLFGSLFLMRFCLNVQCHVFSSPSFLRAVSITGIKNANMLCSV